MQDILTYLGFVVASALLTKLAHRYKLAADIIDGARKLLASDQNNITDPRKAVEQALVQAQFEAMTPMVKKLDDEIARGKLALRSLADAEERLLNSPNVTIVPRDGSEEFKPAFPKK